MPRRCLGGDMRFVHRFVREHRISGDVADGVNVRHVGPHLLVGVDEAALGDRDARLFGGDLLAIGNAADRDQDQVVGLRLFALE